MNNPCTRSILTQKYKEIEERETDSYNRPEIKSACSHEPNTHAHLIHEKLLFSISSDRALDKGSHPILPCKWKLYRANNREDLHWIKILDIQLRTGNQEIIKKSILKKKQSITTENTPFHQYVSAISTTLTEPPLQNDSLPDDPSPSRQNSKSVNPKKFR